jgi:hypothetical protein
MDTTTKIKETRVNDFKEAMLKTDFDDVLVNILLSDEAIHCDEDARNFIKTKIKDRYNLTIEDVKLIVVGSAKLGFSITEKIDKNGNLLERYRAFRADSDIDLAIVSPKLFSLIWDELSLFSYNQPYMPWDSGRLGDYMLCGWLRPDYFPRRSNLRKCADWWSIFTNLSAHHRFGRRRVRGGIYYSFEQLKYYQSKGLRDCINAEKLGL